MWCCTRSFTEGAPWSRSCLPELWVVGGATLGRQRRRSWRRKGRKWAPGGHLLPAPVRVVWRSSHTRVDLCSRDGPSRRGREVVSSLLPPISSSPGSSSLGLGARRLMHVHSVSSSSVAVGRRARHQSPETRGGRGQLSQSHGPGGWGCEAPSSACVLETTGCPARAPREAAVLAVQVLGCRRQQLGPPPSKYQAPGAARGTAGLTGARTKSAPRVHSPATFSVKFLREMFPDFST